jgi:formamidopyrimidine-DNA glycosylase
VRRHVGGGADFTSRIIGGTALGARRRGKYLWLPLAVPGQVPVALVAHLGMSGQLLLQPPDAPAEKHLRVRFRFSDSGRELRFVDQRTFGALVLDTMDDVVAAPGADPLPRTIVHIARDPLDPAFDDEALHRALRRRRTGLKRALLDQSLVSGIGNIYADEALWRAHLHPARPTETMTRAETARVLAGVRDVMTAALAQGGTSFDSLYVNVNGQSGYFERSLEAYGRAGGPCHRCGTPIAREPFMNRSSFRCPRCQPRPRRARS